MAVVPAAAARSGSRRSGAGPGAGRAGRRRAGRRAPLGGWPPSGASAGRATTRGPAWRSSPGCGRGRSQPGRRAPIAAEALRLAGRLRGCGLRQRRGPGRTARGPRAARGRARGRGEAADRGRAPPRAGGAAGRQACCAGWPGPSWRSGTGGRGGAGRAPGGPGDGAGPARPAGQRRPADRHRRAGRGSGRGRPAAGAGPRDPRRWYSPGWNAPGRRRSGSGRCARPPTRRRRPSWPSCASSAYLIRQAELNGRRDPAADRQARRAAARDQGARAGRPAAWARPRPQASLGEVSAALGESGQTPGRHPGPDRRDARGGACGPDPRASSGSATSKRPPRRPGG